MPVVLGHEGSGVVTRLGEGVDDLAEGDHVVLSWVPQCGECRQCRAGRPWQCELVADVVAPGGVLHDGTSRWGGGLHHYLGVSSFAERVVVPRSGAIRIRDDAPLDLVAIVGCAVATGVGCRAQHRRGARGRDGRRDRLRRRRALRRAGRAAGARLAHRGVRHQPGEARGRAPGRRDRDRGGAALGVRLRVRRDREDRDHRAGDRRARPGRRRGDRRAPADGQHRALRPAGRWPRRTSASSAPTTAPSTRSATSRGWSTATWTASWTSTRLVSGRRPLGEAAEALEDLAAGRTLRTLLITTQEDGHVHGG